MSLDKNSITSTGYWFALAGICLGAGFVWPVFWWTVFLGVALFFLAVERSKTLAEVAFGGWLAFSLKMLLALGWFLTTYPIRWIDLGLGFFEFPVISFYWLTVSMVMGLSGLVIALCGHWFKYYGGWWIVVMGLLWVPGEVLGAWLFSIFTYGDGGTISPLFSFGMAGYHLTENFLLLQLAHLYGVYALSVTAVGLGILLFVNFRRFSQLIPRLVAVLIFLVLIGTSMIDNPLSYQLLPKSVAVVDTYFGGEDFFSLPNREEVKKQTLLEAFAVAKSYGASYIIFPEDSRLIPTDLSPTQAYAFYRLNYGDYEGVWVESGRVPIALHEATTRTTIYDGVSKAGYGVDKQQLVPQGEFMPTFYLVLLKLLGLAQSVETIKGKLDYRPGPYQSQLKLPEHVPGILFCFNEADPLSVHRFVNERKMPFIAHPISHAWFNSPESLWYQFDAMRKIHAVWNQTSIISAGNMVSGAWYTTAGTKVSPAIVAKGEWWQVSLLP